MGFNDIVIAMLLVATAGIAGAWWTTLGYQRERYVVPEHELHGMCSVAMVAALAIDAVALASVLF